VGGVASQLVRRTKARDRTESGEEKQIVTTSLNQSQLRGKKKKKKGKKVKELGKGKGVQWQLRVKRTNFTKETERSYSSSQGKK